MQHKIDRRTMANNQHRHTNEYVRCIHYYIDAKSVDDPTVFIAYWRLNIQEKI